MTTNSTSTSETSVMFSLAELADIEAERVAEENANRRARELEQKRAEAARRDAMRAAEDARVAAEITRREERERERAEAEARDAARERAVVEVARIEAEAQERLRSENALRDHELRLFQIKHDKGRTRLRHALAAVVGVVVLGGSAAGWSVNGHVSQLTQQSQRLRDERWTLAQAHERALSAELTALDKRHERLRAKAGNEIAEQARLRAEAARAAIEASSVDTPKLRAFGDSLDQLEARVSLSERIAMNDRRFSDLSQWAIARGEVDVLASTKRAAESAHAADVDETAVAGYTTALDGAADKLASASGKTRARGAAPRGKTTPPTTTAAGPKCKNKWDPICGLDGEMLGGK